MHTYEGTIITCDALGSVKRFLIEDRGKIVFVGDTLPEEYAAARRTNLDGRALLPAFADTHIHFLSHASFAAGLDVRDAQTIDQLLASITEYADRHPRGLIIGFGVSPHSVAEKRLPTREEIDSVCARRPVFLVKYDGHAAVANSRLVAMLPQKTAAERGFDAASGWMTQDAFFRVADYVTSKVPLGKALADMLAAVDGLARRGIGMIHSVSGVGFPLDLDVTLECLFARGLQNPLPYRVFFQTMDVDKVVKRKLPRVGGCFETALDGSFGSVDAALLQPYANDERNSGVLFYADEVVHNFTRTANRAGLQIQMHAIGDRAFAQAVSALAAALDDYPRSDHRHTIIHAFLPTQQGLEACARLGIAVAVQPALMRTHFEPFAYLEEILGARASRVSPHKSMTALGITLAGGSDGPVTPPDPILGIWAACNHPVESESLSIQQALDLYTRNAAWMSFDDRERGSLEPGKTADMVILDRNPLATDPKNLRAVRVEQLLLGAEPYRPNQSRTSLLWRGLLSRRAT